MSPPPTPSGTPAPSGGRGSRPAQTWGLLAWFIGIGVAAAVLGTMDNAPGQDIPTARWTAEAALVGVGAGLLFGVFFRQRPWRQEGGVIELVGACVYSLVYEVAVLRGYGGGDSGGEGLLFGVIAVICLVPLVGAAAFAHALRAPPRADEQPPATAPPPDQPPFWPPPPGWKPQKSAAEQCLPRSHDDDGRGWDRTSDPSRVKRVLSR